MPCDSVYRHRSLPYRQEDGEDSPTSSGARVALHANRSMVLLYDVRADP